MARILAKSLVVAVAALLLGFGCSRHDDRLHVFVSVGPKGGHDYSRFLTEWKALLKERGAVVQGAANFPSNGQLKKTDVLVLYSGEERMLSSQEQTALEQFVQRGGGLILLHDAIRSANPDWLKNNAGGAWDVSATKSRSGPMGLYFANHPITAGVSNFELDDDELSYRLQMAPDANVVASASQSATETAPQIWTYEKNNHRTVVCLPGHNLSTFELPHFRALLLRSIAWAAKKDADLLARTAELATLAYPAGGPTSPDEAAKKIKLDSDFNLSLVAAEPLIAKPTWVDWDPKGRMWVAIRPAHSENTNPANDAVVILEDTNGDGRMDKKQVFADGLNHLTSFVFYRDGIIVSQPPDILRLRDTDGDGIADKREVLFSGFPDQDQRSMIGSFRWGFDGWVYGAQGASNESKTIVNGVGKGFTNIGSGLLRFKPNASAIEMVSAFESNSRGLGFSWDGELFFSRSSGPHMAHVMMPEKFLERGRVAKTTSDKTIEDHQKAFPLVTAQPAPGAKGAPAGQFFTNVSGCTIYQGGAWPRRYQNSAFVCDSSLHIVHEDIITPVIEDAARGIGYEAIKAQKNEFLASADPWFRPIYTQYGPDGAMYLLDFYNQASLQENASTLQRFNASTQPDHGRIWRIQHKHAQKLDIPPLVDAPSTNLVKALEHPNAWVRMNAQRLLVERGDTNVTKALSLLIASNRVAYVRVHAVWTLAQLHGLRETNLVAAISDRHPSVQKNALRVVTEGAFPLTTNVEVAVLKQAKEADDRAKLNGLFALQQGGLKKETRQSILRHIAEQKDVWSKSAYLGVAMTAPMEFIKEALATDKGDHLKDAVGSLADSLVESGSLSNAIYLVQRLGRDPEKGGASALQGAILDSFTRAESPDFIPPWTPELEKAFHNLLAAKSSTIRYNALALANRWDTDHTLSEDADKARKKLLDELRKGDLKDDARMRIITVVMSIPSLHSDFIPLLEKLFTTNTSAAVVNHLVKELGRSSDKAVPPVLIKHFGGLNSEGKQLALSVLFKRPEWVSSLIEAVADKEIQLKDLGVDAMTRLHHHTDPTLAKRATEVIESIQGPLPKDKETVIAKFLPALAKPADLKNGGEVFKRHCTVCHRLGEKDRDKDKFKDIGPDLVGVGVWGPELLLRHILDPNRALETNYIAYNVTTKKHEDYFGIIVSETKETMKVRNILGDTDIRIPDIVAKKSSGISVMPEGLEALGEKNLRDVIAYISDKAPKGYRTVDLTSAFTADSRKGLFAEQNDKPSLEFKKFGLLTIDTVPFNIANPDALAAGKNVIVLKGGTGFAKTLPQRVEIPVATKAARIYVLGGIAGWGFPNAESGGTNDPLVRAEIVYSDNETEEVLFRNGYEFADYVKRIDVPGSRYVPDLVADGQLRLFSFKPKRTNDIAKIVLESFDRQAAPTFVAMTAQLTDR